MQHGYRRTMGVVVWGRGEASFDGGRQGATAEGGDICGRKG